MINFQFFPRSHGVTPGIREIIESFKMMTIKLLLKLKQEELYAIINS